MKREFTQNLSRDEVCYTNSLILLVKNMLCGKLHYQQGFKLILVSYKSAPVAHALGSTPGPSNLN